MYVSRVLSLAFIALLFGCEAKSPADEYLADAVALKRGRSVFAGTCGGYCHSVTKGARDAPYLFDCVWLHGDSDEDVFNTIANGVPGTRMISFSGKLPEGDNDIWKIVAYLKSKKQSCR